MVRGVRGDGRGAWDVGLGMGQPSKSSVNMLTNLSQQMSRLDWPSRMLTAAPHGQGGRSAVPLPMCALITVQDLGAVGQILNANANSSKNNTS